MIDFHGKIHYASLLNDQLFLELPVLKCHSLSNMHQTIMGQRVRVENSAISLKVRPLALPLTQ